MSDTGCGKDACASFLLSADINSVEMFNSRSLTETSKKEFSNFSAVKQDLVSAINKKLKDDPECFGTVARQVISFVDAVQRGHFEFKREPWHDVSTLINDSAPSAVSEYLLRVGDEKDNSPFAVINALYAADSHENDLRFKFESFIAYGAFNQVSLDENVSINFAVETILDRRFQKMMRQARGERDPSTIVIEVLEHDVPDVDIFKNQRQLLRLSSMEKAGYRFAIDDFQPYNNQGHWARLKKFGEYVSIIKFDREWLKSAYEHELGMVCDHVRDVCGEDVFLIAEGVKTPEDAAIMYAEFGIQAVQGWELPDDTLARVRIILNNMKSEKEKLVKIYDPILAL